jgi:hypothetical protein
MVARKGGTQMRDPEAVVQTRERVDRAMVSTVGMKPHRLWSTLMVDHAAKATRQKSNHAKGLFVNGNSGIIIPTVCTKTY